MKALYNKLKKKQAEIRYLSAELDRLIQERWGFDYSQTDNDRIIDTLDYGTDDLEYSDFVRLMDKLKEQVDNGEIALNP